METWLSYPQNKPNAHIDKYVDFLVAFDNPYYRKPKFEGDISSTPNVPKFYYEVSQWTGDKFLTSKPVRAFMRIPQLKISEVQNV